MVSKERIHHQTSILSSFVSMNPHNLKKAFSILLNFSENRTTRMPFFCVHIMNQNESFILSDKLTF